MRPSACASATSSAIAEPASTGLSAVAGRTHPLARSEAGAVAVHLRQLREPARQTAPLPDLGALAQFSRPMSTDKDYDALLVRRPKQMEVH